jgi:peptidoglycan/LPS O-acetylase OafA/YrhL
LRRERSGTLCEVLERAAAASPQLELVPKSRYIPEFDVMRGVAILFVIYLHAWFGPWQGVPHHEILYIHAIHLFANTAVPVFFFISGFLLPRDRSPSFGAFLVRKARRIYVPLLVWMVASLLYQVWQQDGLTGEMLKDFALFNISGQFYFVIVLLIFTVAFYFVRTWSVERLRCLAIAAFVANLATVLYYRIDLPTGGSVAAVLSYRNPLMWVFSFAVGFYIGRSEGSLAWTRKLFWPALAGMAAIYAAYIVLGERYDQYPASYFGVTVFLFGCLGFIVYPALVMAVLERAPGRAVLEPLRRLSRYSFAIYLIHQPFFLNYFADRIVSDDTRFNYDYFRLVNALFVVGAIGVIVLVVVVARVAPRFAREFMGIEPPRVPVPESPQPYAPAATR